MRSEHELRIEPELERRKPKLVEPADLDAGRAFEGETVERRPTPVLECLAQGRGALARRKRTTLVDGVLEPERVDVLGVDMEQVTGRSPLDHLAPEHPAQTEDAVLDLCLDRPRRTLTPQLVDQPVGRHHRFGWSSKRARIPFCFRPPRASGSPPACTSSGPRTRNSMPRRTYHPGACS